MPPLRLIFLTIAIFLILGETTQGQEASAVEHPEFQESVQSAQAAPQEQISGDDFNAARHLVQQGKYDDAIAVLHEIEAKHTGRKGLSHEFGVTYYKKSDFPNAILYLQKAQEENPNDKEAVQLQGLSYYLTNRSGEAIPLLERVQSWFPSVNIDASYILGLCYIQTRDYPHARSAFAKMFGVAPDSAASYLFTARMLLRQELELVADEYARKAVSLDPKLPLAHFLLGEVNLYHSKIPEAIAEFQKELELNPGYAAAYYKLADAYSRVQKFDEAEKLLQRSIWLDSTSTGPYILMGKVLEKKGEAELAVRALQHALAMDPNNPMPHHLLGQAYRDLGRNEDADRELTMAGELTSRQNAKP